MADKSNIEWTEATWNPVTGCTKVSPGCDHCYAIRMSQRLSHHPKYRGLVVQGEPTKDGFTPEWTGEVRCHPEALDEPLRWKKPKTIFVCSMSDLFHSQVPWEFIGKVFDVMAASPRHTYQVLTKRPGRMAHFAEHIWPKQANQAHRTTRPLAWGGTWEATWPPNVWAGTSLEQEWDGQRHLVKRLDCLARVPAKVRFVSVEPMLGPVDLTRWLLGGVDMTNWSWPEEGPSIISWVIVGGESGPGARPMHADWARSLRNQCQEAGVPFFFKQWGQWGPFRDNGPLPPNCHYIGLDGAIRIGDYEADTDGCMGRGGKKAAGALLDGREWREMPAGEGS